MCNCLQCCALAFVLFIPFVCVVCVAVIPQCSKIQLHRLLLFSALHLRVAAACIISHRYLLPPVSEEVTGVMCD